MSTTAEMDQGDRLISKFYQQEAQIPPEGKASSGINSLMRSRGFLQSYAPGLYGRTKLKNVKQVKREENMIHNKIHHKVSFYGYGDTVDIVCSSPSTATREHQSQQSDGNKRRLNALHKNYIDSVKEFYSTPEKKQMEKGHQKSVNGGVKMRINDQRPQSAVKGTKGNFYSTQQPISLKKTSIVKMLKGEEKAKRIVGQSRGCFFESQSELKEIDSAQDIELMNLTPQLILP